MPAILLITSKKSQIIQQLSIKNADDIATNKANIDQNTTAIARKISLGSDDGDTDKKSLSTGRCEVQH